MTEGRPGLAFSFSTAPAGGAALKQTSPYWYSFSVAVNSLGGCEVLLASTCAEHQLSADHCYSAALKQTSPYLCSFSVAVNCFVPCEVQLASTCATLPLWIGMRCNAEAPRPDMHTAQAIAILANFNIWALHAWTDIQYFMCNCTHPQ